MLKGCKGDHGCQTQLHGTNYIYGVAQNKEQKIINRIISHQLIILDNPLTESIERIELTNSAKTEECKLSEAQVVKPSSLNYKISLIEAAIAFQNRDKNAD